MKISSAESSLSIVILCVVTIPVFAHHSASPYEHLQTELTLKGTVTDYQFINPHVEISVDVTNDKGKVESWIGEANSPNVLSRHGWDRDIIKKGDTITVIGNAGKNGSKTLRLQKVVLSNGKELDPNSINDWALCVPIAQALLPVWVLQNAHSPESMCYPTRDSEPGEISLRS